MRVSYFWVTLFAALTYHSAFAQSPAPVKVLDFPAYRLEGRPADADGASVPIGAKLCLLQPRNACYQMPAKMEQVGSKVEYEFGLGPVSERISLKSGGAVIFFLATFSGGGSGTLERAALLRYQPDGTIVNLLPYVAVTNQSQRQMWSLPDFSEYPILVTADFLWDFHARETHFAKHFYQVEGYRFDSRTDRYLKAFSYRTAKKYAGLDAAEGVRVLDPERNEILRHLRSSVSGTERR